MIFLICWYRELRPLNEHTTHERPSSVIFFSRKLSCYLFAFSRLYRVIYNSLGYNIVITLFPTESTLKLYASCRGKRNRDCDTLVLEYKCEACLIQQIWMERIQKWHKMSAKLLKTRREMTVSLTMTIP